MKRTASAKNGSKSSGSSTDKRVPKPAERSRYALCLSNAGSEDLVVLKIYRVLKDAKAAKAKHLRIVDESGENFLYPASYFCLVALPATAQRSLKEAPAVAWGTSNQR